MSEDMEALYTELRKHEDATDEVRRRIHEIESAKQNEHFRREQARARVELSASLRKEWEEKGEVDGGDLRAAVAAFADLSFLPDEVAYRFDTGKMMPVLQFPALANAQEQALELWRQAHDRQRENDNAVKRLREANEAIQRETCEKVGAIVAALSQQEQRQFGANRIRKDELLRRSRFGWSQ